MSERKHFSDFAKDEIGLIGDKLQIGEVFNQEIYVTDYRILASKCIKGKEVLQLQFELNDHTYIVFTNSEVMIRQIKQYESEIPFLTVIKKVGSYHTFS